MKSRRVWECYGCKKQFSLKVGTIFEDSPITLDKWMMVAWMLTNCKNGVSSYEIHRSIGVTQKTACLCSTGFVSDEARADRELGSNEGGEVEVTRRYVGAKVKNMHHKRKLKLQKELTEIRPSATRPAT